MGRRVRAESGGETGEDDTHGIGGISCTEASWTVIGIGNSWTAAASLRNDVRMVGVGSDG